MPKLGVLFSRVGAHQCTTIEEKGVTLAGTTIGDLRHDYGVIPPRVSPLDPALHPSQRSLQERASKLPVHHGQILKSMIRVGLGEPEGQFFLIGSEEAHAEMTRLEDRVVAIRIPMKADEDEGWVEGN